MSYVSPFGVEHVSKGLFGGTVNAIKGFKPSNAVRSAGNKIAGSGGKAYEKTYASGKPRGMGRLNAGNKMIGAGKALKPFDNKINAGVGATAVAGGGYGAYKIGSKPKQQF